MAWGILIPLSGNLGPRQWERETLCIASRPSLNDTLFSLALCPMKSHPSAFLSLSAPSAQLVKPTNLPSASFSLRCSLESLQGSAEGNHKAHHMFPFSWRIIWSFDIHCLKIAYNKYIFCLFLFVCFMWEGKSSLFYSIIVFSSLYIFWMCCVACGILVPRPGIESVSPAV